MSIIDGIKFVVENQLNIRECRIINSLLEKPKTTNQIAFDLEVGASGISQVLVTLKRLGIVEVKEMTKGIKLFGLTDKIHNL